MTRIDPRAAQQIAIRRDIRVNTALQEAKRLRATAGKIVKALETKDISTAGFFITNLSTHVNQITHNLDALMTEQELLEIIEADLP